MTSTDETPQSRKRGLNLANWVIAAGVITAAGLGWYSLGMPGMSLQDGNYSCRPGSGQLSTGWENPGALVSGGEVVQVEVAANLPTLNPDDFGNGDVRTVSFSEVKQTGGSSFSVRTENADAATGKYECKLVD